MFLKFRGLNGLFFKEELRVVLISLTVGVVSALPDRTMPPRDVRYRFMD